MQLEGGECGGLEEQKEAGGQSPEGDRRRKLEMRPENLGGLDHARPKSHGKDCVHDHSLSQYLLGSCPVLVMEGLIKLGSSFKVLRSSGSLLNT